MILSILFKHFKHTNTTFFQSCNLAGSCGGFVEVRGKLRRGIWEISGESSGGSGRSGFLGKAMFMKWHHSATVYRSFTKMLILRCVFQGLSHQVWELTTDNGPWSKTGRIRAAAQNARTTAPENTKQLWSMGNQRWNKEERVYINME